MNASIDLEEHFIKVPPCRQVEEGLSLSAGRGWSTTEAQKIVGQTRRQLLAVGVEIEVIAREYP